MNSTCNQFDLYLQTCETNNGTVTRSQYFRSLTYTFFSFRLIIINTHVLWQYFIWPRVILDVYFASRLTVEFELLRAFSVQRRDRCRARLYGISPDQCALFYSLVVVIKSDILQSAFVGTYSRCTYENHYFYTTCTLTSK